MTSIAIILLVLSVFVHAGWNAASRQHRPATGFMLIASATGAVALAPIVIWNIGALARVPPVFWAVLVGTCFFMTIYYASLAGAYRAGDLSLVYPVARALPALMVPTVRLCMGCGQSITWLLGIGAGLIVAGVALLPMQRFSDLRASHYGSRAFVLALCAAVGTTGYTVLDYYGMRLIQAPRGPLGPVAAPMVYMAIQGFVTALFLLSYILARTGERAELPMVLRSSWRIAALTGLAIYLTYILVLAAYTQVRDPSYVAVFRQLSIPVGAVLGFLLLREKRTLPRLTGLAMISVGVVLGALG